MVTINSFMILKIIIIIIILYQFKYIQNVSTTKRYNRYLSHIFNKYGDGGTLSFEGIEHLMYNLGLGGLEFNLTHTIEEHHPDGYSIPDIKFIRDDIVTKINDQNENKKISNINFEYASDKNDAIVKKNRETDGYTTTTAQNTEIVGSSLIITGLNFKEMHDPKHRHPRHYSDNGISDDECLSPKSLMKLVIDSDDHKLNQLLQRRVTKRNTNSQEKKSYKPNDDDDEEQYNDFITSSRITPDVFMKLCPALLVQIDQDACAQYIVKDDEHTSVRRHSYSWIYATVAICIISCCGLLGIVMVPLIKSSIHDEIIKFLIAVAIGTLCGDALMHLMPHALIKDHQNDEPIWLCSCAFFTVLLMYAVETLLPILKGTNDHNHGHGHGHHSHAMRDMDLQEVPKITNTNANEINIMLNETEPDKKGKRLTPVAFMVIIGDGLHNFTDGLAIGAAFANDPVTGMATTFAVLCHELPHELGDFALLLQTGVKFKKAMYLNIVSSVLSFMGMAIGLFLAEMHSNTVQWIYVSTAGSFLYIALADLIPEIGRTGETNIKNSVIQIFGIFIGGVIMTIIALNEDKLRVLFQ